MGLLTEISKLTKRLYPTGKAFKIPFSSVFQQLHDGLNESEKRAVEDGKSILDTILPDNDNFSTEDASNWERRLGLIEKPTVSLDERKAAILRKMNHPADILARQHYLYVQGQLQLAGFNLWVYENRFDDGGGGFFEKQTFEFERIFTDPAGILQHGDVQHGLNVGLKVANHIDEVIDSVYLVSNLRQTFFIGGSNAGERVDVTADRKNELRQLILLLKPAHSIAYLLVDFADGIFDTIEASLGASFITNNIDISVSSGRCYWLESGQIRVLDIGNDVEIAGEKFGAGTIGTATGFLLDPANDRAYICDDSGAEEIKVFEISTQIYKAAENFGSGVLDKPESLRISGGKAYVVDSGATKKVFVFNVSTGAHIAAEDFGSGDLTLPVDIELFDDKAYILDKTLNNIVVFDITDGTHLDAEDLKSVQLNAPLKFRLVNGLFYVANTGSNEVEVFDRITKQYNAAKSFFSLGVVGLDIVNNDFYSISNSTSVIEHRTKN